MQNHSTTRRGPSKFTVSSLTAFLQSVVLLGEKTLICGGAKMNL
jgi:hypothetical protein